MGHRPERAEPVRQVVSNTGPLLHLSEIGALQLLEAAGTISIPPAVDSELSKLLPIWSTTRPSWISIRVPEPAAIAQIAPWLGGHVLHLGEAQALALAHQTRADWFLTEDTAARLVSKTLGLETHGSLGVVLWAAANGRIDKSCTTALVDQLAASSLWLSHRILADAKTAIENIFAASQ